MTTIEQHISNLLYTHECVIIHDFGAFVATTISAKIDRDKNILFPPVKEIGFNRSLSHNDGLLVSTYAQIKEISYNVAKEEVEKFRIRLIDELEAGNEVLIERVGTLKRDAIGHVQFTSSSSENYLTDSFGLSSFHFTPDIRLDPVKDNVQVKRLLRPLKQKHIAATVTLLIGLFAISPSVNDKTTSGDLNTASTIDFFVNSHPAETTLQLHEEDFTSKIVTKENSEVESDVMEAHFFIIAGSFKREAQAQQFLKRVQSMGEQQAYILVSANKRYRIALDGYSSKPEAINSMNNYRKLEEFKTVWVLKQ